MVYTQQPGTGQPLCRHILTARKHLSEKMPPSHGLSGGPEMDADQRNRESEMGAALTPSGGFCVIYFRSASSLSDALVVITIFTADCWVNLPWVQMRALQHD
jgi:hypothetical protein